MYRVAMAVCRPVAAWGRLQVEGLELLPESGPLLVVGNHDSHWDPVMVGVAAIRRRQIKALAKSTLWDVKGLAPVLNGMGQIPIERGAGDARGPGAGDRGAAGRGLHRRLPGGNPLKGTGAASAQRGGAPRSRGPRGATRLRGDRGDDRPHTLPPPPAGQHPLLRARRRTGPARRGAGGDRLAAPGGDPRARSPGGSRPGAALVHRTQACRRVGRQADDTPDAGDRPAPGGGSFRGRLAPRVCRS